MSHRWTKPLAPRVSPVPGPAATPPTPRIEQADSGVDPRQVRRCLEQLIPRLSARLASSRGSRSAMLGEALQHAAEALGVDHAFLWSLYPDGEPELTHEWCDERSGASQIAGVEPPPELPWLWARVRRREPLVVESVEDLPAEAGATRGFLCGLGLRALVAIPLVAEGQPLGCLAFATVGREYAWTPDTVALLLFVGDVLVGSLRPANGTTQPFVAESSGRPLAEPPAASTDAEPQAPAEASAATQIGRPVPSFDEVLRAVREFADDNGAEPGERLRRLLEVGCRAFGLDSGLLCRLEDTQGEIVQCVDHDDARLDAGDRFARVGGPLFLALSRDEPVVVNAVEPDAPGQRIWANGPLARAALIQRVQVDDTNFGLLVFCSRRARAANFASAETDALRLLAHTIERDLETRLGAERLRVSQFALERSPVSALWFDAKGSLVYVNEAACSMLAYPRRELLGRTVDEVGLLSSQQGFTGQWEAIRDEKRVDLETMLRARSGEELPVRLTAGHVELEGREYVCASAEDLRPLRHAENARQDAEGRYRALFEESPDALMTLDPLSGMPVDLNARILELLGYERHLLLRQPFAELGCGPCAQEIRDRCTVALHKSTSQQFESRLRAVTGEIRDVMVLLRPVELSGRVLLHCIVRDVSERKAAERTLRESEERFARAFRSAPAAMLILRLSDGQVVDANDELLRVAGMTRGEAVGRAAADLGFWPEGADDDRLFHALRRQGAVRKWEFVFRRSSEEEPRHAVLSAEVLDIAGDRCALAALEDVTERKRATQERDRFESMLRQSQKMEALGRLAGGVAHDFNNILTAILGNTEIVLRRIGPQGEPPSAESLRASLEQVQRAGERGTALVRQLLAFSRKQASKLEPLDPNRIVADLQKMLQRLIGEHIVLQTDLGEGVSRIRGDAAQIEQLLLNLALNARDAMPQGGRLTLTTDNVRREDRDPFFDSPATSFVRIRVSDTGCGMDEETQRQIFEPFFTTKPEGRGTGLGLTTAHDIVKQAGGHIAVQSQPDSGTTFAVYLPATAEPAAALAPVVDERPAVGDETILLCEDEELVRRLAREILDAAGYTVLVAENGREAWELVQEFPERIDLLITDTIMPEMNGVELAQKLTQRHPSLKVLFISGYNPEMLAPHGVSEDRLELLQKPFSATSLLRRVRVVLDHDDG